MNETETEEVRSLLGRAVDGVPAPAGRGAEAVFTRAARLRWRRRAAVTGAVAAVLAGGVLLGSGALPGDGQGAPVAASPTGGGLGTGADGFAKLLPEDVGDLSEVSLMRLIKQAPDAQLPEDVGPYDGDYAVERDGGVGYLTVRAYGAKEAKLKGTLQDPCALADEDTGMTDCTTEKLPDGARLSLWEWTYADDGGQPQWGPELTASLRLKDGTVLRLRDTAGFLGQGSQGPLLKEFPLDRDQLRELALKPELLP
ncbi:hypothetical protein RKD23_002558 [Streptomyces sp. SAI-170]|uniref:hypothetical protein n=1 Tax=Streptomyces sp. SAI-170 TaxID=3377729 RepID=UPI003C7D5467